MKTKNAIITGLSIDDGGRGILTAWLHLDYAGAGQSFGGYVLYLPDGFLHTGGPNYTGHFIYRCMQIAGVDSWDKIKGKSIRIQIEDGLVRSIGHIIKDDWFSPKEDFEMLKRQEK